MEKKKSKPYLLIAIIITAIITATPIIIWQATKYDYKATITSIEYETIYSYINIKVKTNETTEFNSTDFVLYIEGTPTAALGFGNRNNLSKQISITGQKTITVCFKATKNNIDQPINLYINSKKLELNKTITIK